MVSLELGEVVEGILAGKATRVDEAHEAVADLSPVLGLVEEAVVAVDHCLAEGRLANIVIEGGPGHLEEKGKLLPVIQRIGDRLAEARVGLDLPLLDFCYEPSVELLAFLFPFSLFLRKTRVSVLPL